MNIRLTGRGTLARTAAVSVTALAVLGLWAPAAQAAPAVSVVLDPDNLHLSPQPLHGAAAAPADVPIASTSVVRDAVQYSGSVTIVVPPEFTPTTPVAELDFYYPPAGGIARSYASNSAVPTDQLVLTDLGSNQYRVDLPADDGTHACCQVASLRLYGFTSPVPGDPGLINIHPLSQSLDFSGSGPVSVTLDSWVLAQDNGCADVGNDGFCEIHSVPQGTTTVNVTLPVSSSLSSAGLTDLRNATFVQVKAEVNGNQDWATSRVLSAAISADGRTATLTIPAGEFPDLYAIRVVAHQGSRLVATSSLLFQEQAVNKGLRSNTGWGEHEGTTSSGTSPLVPIGATMILAAGVGTALVLRRRNALQD
jgi:hypothetical protein